MAIPRSLHCSPGYEQLEGLQRKKAAILITFPGYLAVFGDQHAKSGLR